MRAMAEAAKILHTDKETTFKVLGKYLRVEDRKILEAGYNGAKHVTAELLIRSIEFREDGGQQNKLLLPEEKKLLAYHEAGHGIAEHVLPYGAGLRKLTIIPHGIGAFGFMRPANDDRTLQFEAWMLDRMTVAMAGRASELYFSGRRYNSVGGDFPAAAHYANMMVRELGMSELGPISHKNLHPSLISDATKREIELAVNKLMSKAQRRALKLVKDYQKGIESVVAALLVKETLDGAEFEKIVGPRPAAPTLSGFARGEAFSRP
jgi:ATP-dependent Zn protease